MAYFIHHLNDERKTLTICFASFAFSSIWQFPNPHEACVLTSVDLNNCDLVSLLGVQWMLEKWRKSQYEEEEKECSKKREYSFCRLTTNFARAQWENAYPNSLAVCVFFFFLNRNDNVVVIIIFKNFTELFWFSAVVRFSIFRICQILCIRTLYKTWSRFMY